MRIVSLPLIFIGLLVIALSAGPYVGACVADEVSPIYVVDVRKVIKESVIGKASMSNMEAERKKKQALLEKLKSEVDKMAEAVQKQKSLLSKAAFREKEDALEKRVLELRRTVQDTENDLAKTNQNEILKVLDEVNVVLKDIANKKPVSFVLDADPQVVVFASDRVDLTETVIKELDERKTSLTSE